jgi:hypothetical protein
VTYFARGVGIFVPHFCFEEIFSQWRLLRLLLLLPVLPVLLGKICLSHGDVERSTGHRRRVIESGTGGTGWRQAVAAVRNKEGEQSREQSRTDNEQEWDKRAAAAQRARRMVNETDGWTGTGAADVRLSRIVSTTKGCWSSSSPSSSSSVMAEESKSKKVVAVGRPRWRDGEDGSSKPKNGKRGDRFRKRPDTGLLSSGDLPSHHIT